jgi:hypothetical protein
MIGAFSIGNIPYVQSISFLVYEGYPLGILKILRPSDGTMR